MRLRALRLHSLCLLIAAFVTGHMTETLAASATSLADVKKSYVRPDDIPFPETNPYTPEKAELGKVLFFDTRLSGSQALSCASCHNASFGWQDGRATGRGEGLKPLGDRKSVV